MKKGSVVILVVVGVVLPISSAWADDYNPPLWRGENNTTMQMWEFLTGVNPSAPDNFVNPNGEAQCTVEGDFPFTVWLPEDDGLQGVWKLEDYVKIDIPNYSMQNPYKEVWLQITFAADGGSGLEPLLLSVPAAAEMQLIDKTKVTNLYWRATYSIILEPNPNSESIYIQPRDCTIYLDEVVIDTICVPEPTTIFLLGLGALALLRKRKA